MAPIAARVSSWPMSVMKPTRPWLMPTSGTPRGTSSRAAASMVPSPPITIARSAPLPSFATSQPRDLRNSRNSRSDVSTSRLFSLPMRATRRKEAISSECTMIRMLDKRAQLLLKTLIERYIEEGQPVGSRTLSKHSGLDLSPATIRNVMSDLEELGFIASPHTSAGRIPTPAGYRFFVDTLLIIKELPSGDRSQLEDQLHPDNPQRVIQSASQLLSQLTQFAGVVMTPRRRAVTFKHLEFLRLSEKRVLLIVVTPEGDVQNRILFTERDYTPGELIEAANYVNQNYAGQSLEDARTRLQGELREIREHMVQLMTVALEASNQALSEGNEQYVVSGERNLFATQDIGRLKQVLEMFERKTSLLQILDLSLRGQGVQVFIGGESGVNAPDDVSVVTSPYKVDGEVVGTVGVIGPTRMAYDRVVPIVDITARLLSSALSKH